MPSYRCLNKVMLIGNLTNEVTVKYLQSGTQVGNTRIALNESYTDKNSGQEVDNTSFVDLQIWGKQAEVAQKYLSKGDRVFVEGSIKSQRWETPEGQIRSRVLVKVLRFMFMSYKNRENEYEGEPITDSNDLPDDMEQMGAFL